MCDLIAAFQYTKEAYKKGGERHRQKFYADRTMGNSFKQKERRFSLNIRMKVMRHWNTLSREDVDAPSLEVFNGALCSLEVLVGCSFEQSDLVAGRSD